MAPACVCDLDKCILPVPYHRPDCPPALPAARLLPMLSGALLGAFQRGNQNQREMVDDQAPFCPLQVLPTGILRRRSSWTPPPTPTHKNVAIPCVAGVWKPLRPVLLPAVANRALPRPSSSDPVANPR